jgi:hypothetical protein
LVVIAAAVSAGVAGCSANSSFTLNPFQKKKGPEPEVLPAAEWRDIRQANAQRIHGEGIPTTRPAPSTRVNTFEEFAGFLKFTFWDFPKQTISYYLGNTPGKYARMMEDDQSGDVRRTGILRLVVDYPFARTVPYTQRYWQIAQGDPDALVRVAAVRALNRSRDRSVVTIAVRYLDSADPLLRLEAAKALANVPDETAVPALLRHMAPQFDQRAEGGRLEPVPETRDVRVACADALRNYPTKDVATALIDVLHEKEFEVSWQARKSLILMTGHDYHYDQARWREFLSKSDNPFG